MAERRVETRQEATGWFANTAESYLLKANRVNEPMLVFLIL